MINHDCLLLIPILETMTTNLYPPAAPSPLAKATVYTSQSKLEKGFTEVGVVVSKFVDIAERIL